LQMIEDSQARNLGQRLDKVFAGKASPVVLSLEDVDASLRGKTVEDRLTMKVMLMNAGVLPRPGRR
jgi:hypothetical protein